MNRTEVSKLPLWESIYFGDWSSALVVFGQNGRLMRWALVLQQYQFTVKAIKGSEKAGPVF